MKEVGQKRRKKRVQIQKKCRIHRESYFLETIVDEEKLYKTLSSKERNIFRKKQYIQHSHTQRRLRRFLSLLTVLETANVAFTELLQGAWSFLLFKEASVECFTIVDDDDFGSSLQFSFSFVAGCAWISVTILALAKYSS